MMKTELQALCEKFDGEMATMRSELTENMQTWATQAAEALVDQRRQLDSTIKDLDTRLSTEAAKDRDDEAQALVDVCDKQKAVDDAQDDKSQRAQAELYVKMGLLDEKLSTTIAKLEAETKEVHSLHVAEYSDFLGKTEKHLEVLD